MGRYIVKLTDKRRDYYLEWSTVVDAPVTYGMSLEQFRRHYQSEYGNSAMREFDERMKRVEDKGTSSLMHKSVAELVAYNRAGDNETRLTMKELIEKYCQRKGKK